VSRSGPVQPLSAAQPQEDLAPLESPPNPLLLQFE
jgi:hypothetical protein